MSTDFENELRDLFREKAEEAPLATPTLPATAPQQVLRRSRRHQVGTVLGSAVVVVALLIGSVAGLTRILGDGGGDRDIGDGGYEIFQRSATVEAFTVASPSDWFLVNQWPLSMQIAVGTSGGASSACVAQPGNADVECEDTPSVETLSPIPVPRGLPMLQLSNVDLGLTTNACEAGVPGGAAVLYVALDYDAAIGGIADPSIQEFTPGAGLPPEGDGPCGPGRYAHFTVNGERFFSWIGIGSGVSDEDRATVETSYEMMTAISDWTPARPEHGSPGYVVAGGATDAGEGWRLEVRSETDIELSLIIGRIVQASIGTEPTEWWRASSTDPTQTSEVIFGAIGHDTTSVEFRPVGGRAPIPGTILPLPPSFGSSVDMFFIEGAGGLAGEVVATGPAPSEASSPPVAEARIPVVTLRDTLDGHDWTARFRGDFEDATACIDVTIDGSSGEAICPRPIATSLAGDQPSLHVVNTADVAVVVGSVPPEVVEIRFTSDSGNTTPSEFACQVGPIGWTDPDRNVCAMALPPQDGGTFEYLGSNRDVLFEEGMAWFSSQGEPVDPTPVDPVHGGTYWAVYPWVGAAGSPDGDNMSALLLEDFGIEASPGDLSCDDGAAEALGTDAPQGIGVYFETQEEANDFAMQAGLLGHEADPVIARVTTYCLD